MSQLPLPYPKVFESFHVECPGCQNDLGCEAHDVCVHNDNTGDVTCKCGVTLFVAILRGDSFDGYMYGYSIKPFADVCAHYTEYPRCPNCGHEFNGQELDPDSGDREIFGEVAWDPTEHDYDKTKTAIVRCPHCSQDMFVRMMPPARPQPKYCSYRFVERICETCGETHHFNIVKRTDDGVLLSDEGTGHVQEAKISTE